MGNRWSALLAGLVTALGSAACSDGSSSGGPDGVGGSGGSNPGTSGAPSDGGTPSVDGPKVGLDLSLGSPDPPIPNTECFPAGQTSIGDPAPTLDPVDPGQPVSSAALDGSVVCAVLGPDPFSVSATIADGSFRFKVSSGSLDAEAGTGSFKLLIDTQEAGDIVTEVEQLCTFDVSESPLEVSEGNLVARFACPVLWNHATATDTACGAEGVLVLERCAN